MKKQVIILLFSIFVIFLGQFFIGNKIFDKIFFNYPKNHIINFLDFPEKIKIQGRICGEVDRRIFKTNYEVCVKRIFLLKKDKDKFLQKQKKFLENFDKNEDKNFLKQSKQSKIEESFFEKIKIVQEKTDEKQQWKREITEQEKFFLRGENFSDIQKNFLKGEKIFSEGKILISTRFFPEYNLGDEVKIYGKLKKPFENKDFSYKNFLLKDGIFGTMNFGQIKFLGNGDFFNYSWFEKIKYSFFERIFAFKKIFLERIEQIYPSPHSAFLAGLLVGDRKGLPDDVKTDFQKNGLAHIVAISGYNITIIILFISGIFFFLPRKLGIILSAIFVVLFTIFVGGTSAVVRASVMGILGLLALYYGRDKNILILILASVFLMSVRNPMMLWWDIGFHLSVLAVLGVVYLVKIFEKFTKNIQNFFGIKEIILLTISASLMTFPLISYHFGIVSLISPIANLVVTPLIPLAMLLGFFSVVFSFLGNFGIFYFLKEFFGFLTYSVLDFSLKMSHFFANLKYSFVEFKIGILGVLLFYLFLGFLFLRFREEFE
ncbi:ComEC family competence protein [Candidatus Gracilibacteria bacterium]|nr:ComEC family competence protein [Candidatus Gracilibacteria bacterium]